MGSFLVLVFLAPALRFLATRDDLWEGESEDDEDEEEEDDADEEEDDDEDLERDRFLPFAFFRFWYSFSVC